MGGMVDVIFADVAQPDQARIVTHNASFFLKNTGWVVISIKANCVDSTAAPEAVFASEVDKLRKDGSREKEARKHVPPIERDLGQDAAACTQNSELPSKHKQDGKCGHGEEDKVILEDDAEDATVV